MPLRPFAAPARRRVRSPAAYHTKLAPSPRKQQKTMTAVPQWDRGGLERGLVAQEWGLVVPEWGWVVLNWGWSGWERDGGPDIAHLWRPRQISRERRVCV